MLQHLAFHCPPARRLLLPSLSIRHLAKPSALSFSTARFRVENPFNGQLVGEVPTDSEADLCEKVRRARTAQKAWKSVALEDRIQLLQCFIEYFKANEGDVGEEISLQMGKPLKHAIGEISGLEERTLAFLNLCHQALSPVTIESSEAFLKVIHKEPKGVVMTLAPWNFPLLTAVNSIVPALLTGNAVLLTHGPKTPLTSIRFKEAIQHSLIRTGLVEGVEGKQHADTPLSDILQDFHVEYPLLKSYLGGDVKDKHAGVDFVSFTGSTTVGKEIYKLVAAGSATTGNIIDCTLELGGNDAAYICQENDSASLNHAVETVVDASFFNAGQSCCAIERVFVHEDHYENVLEQVKQLLEGPGKYVLGNPLEQSTTMGPLAKVEHIAELDQLVADALSKGAQLLVGRHAPRERESQAGKPEGQFFAPVVLAGCSADMTCMQTEIFGPILCLSSVASDDEAVKEINSSPLGLTTAIFTNDDKKMPRFVEDLEVGTVFMNRADYLEPNMPWQGRKDTGKGASLGVDGFRGFYHLKNAHIKFLPK